LKISKDSEKDFEFAYLLDSLEEERKNQLTIDTTQVFCKTKKGKEFIFIDVPGHQGLLKNMLCGSSYADIAILVVDVQKSIEEQTKRHAFILKFLGIKQIIVGLNKMDLVSFDEIVFKKVKQDTIEFLKKTQLQPKYFIPISASQGKNLLKISKKMSWYKGLTLIGALNTCFKNKEDGDFRFPIQDIYNINKERVAVGKIISGEIKKGEKVKILPMDKERQVKTIKVFNKNISVANVPASIGLILNDMDGLKRGQIICKPKLPKINRGILAKIFCVQSFDINKSIILKNLTQKTFARISQIIGVWDIVSLEPKSRQGILEQIDIAEVAIETENPVVVENFGGLNSLGRFVLENDMEICAIGMIC
jgi:small GTP-binding protein